MNIQDIHEIENELREIERKISELRSWQDTAESMRGSFEQWKHYIRMNTQYTYGDKAPQMIIDTIAAHRHEICRKVEIELECQIAELRFQKWLLKEQLKRINEVLGNIDSEVTHG